MKINKFTGKNNKVAYAIDTNKYRYWIRDWKIERFPSHCIDDMFRFEHSELTKLYYDAETYVFDFRKIWKGFQPLITTKQIQMLINRIELLEEDIECIHHFLDENGVERMENNEYLSIIGRIKKLMNNVGIEQNL